MMHLLVFFTLLNLSPNSNAITHTIPSIRQGRPSNELCSTCAFIHPLIKENFVTLYLEPSSMPGKLLLI